MAEALAEVDTVSEEDTAKNLVQLINYLTRKGTRY